MERGSEMTSNFSGHVPDDLTALLPAEVGKRLPERGDAM